MRAEKPLLFFGLLLSQCFPGASMPETCPAPEVLANEAPVAFTAEARTRVLVFSRTTGWRHDSIEPAVAALRTALSQDGWTVEATEDLARINDEALRTFGVVVLLSSTGEPLGSDANGVRSLYRYVRGGGGLVAIHGAADAYYRCNEYAALVGGVFAGHPGNVRQAQCHRQRAHPAVDALPEHFAALDEFYIFRGVRDDRTILLTCDSLDGTQQLPTAWVRTEGRGRVFFTGLGHGIERWQDASLVRDHVVAGVRSVLIPPGG